MRVCVSEQALLGHFFVCLSGRLPMGKQVLTFIYICNLHSSIYPSKLQVKFIYFLISGMASSGRAFPCCHMVCRGTVERHWRHCFITCIHAILNHVISVTAFVLVPIQGCLELYTRFFEDLNLKAELMLLLSKVLCISQYNQQLWGLSVQITEAVTQS